MNCIHLVKKCRYGKSMKNVNDVNVLYHTVSNLCTNCLLSELFSLVTLVNKDVDGVKYVKVTLENKSNESD